MGFSAGNKFHLRLSADELRAEVQVTPEGVKQGIFIEEIARALEARGVIHGVKHDVLVQIVTTPSQFLRIAAVVAEGISPVLGEEGRVEFLLDGNHRSKPVELPDGTMDFHAASTVISVDKDTQIATLHPPVPGFTGTTVTGRPSVPPPTKSMAPKLGPNVELRDDFAIVATSDGHIVLDPSGRLSVLPVLDVGDVDFHVGSVNFAGTVQVAGTIRAGFTVKARGDVRVEGGVEAAVVEAGGSVQIRGVVSSRAHIKAAQNVSARSLEGCHVEAGGSVEIEEGIVQAEVMAGKTIVCKQGRGLVLGGHLQAGVRVQANEFGNQANVATSIEVGVNPHLVKESRELDTESSKLHAQIRRLDPSIAFLQRQASIAALSSSIASALAQSLATRVACDARLAQIHERQAELHEELAHYRGTIDAFRAVHAGVLISIGPNARFFEDPVGRCRLKSIDGEIHVLPL